MKTTAFVLTSFGLRAFANVINTGHGAALQVPFSDFKISIDLEFQAADKAGDESADEPDSDVDAMPIVELGYVNHRAKELNQHGDRWFYNFTSIRYGQDTSKTRWLPPLEPVDVTNPPEEDGSSNRNRCPASTPHWMTACEKRLFPLPCTPGHETWEDCACCDPDAEWDGTCDGTCHNSGHSSKLFDEDAPPSPFGDIYIPGARGAWLNESEDCLMLDVFVPRTIWNDRQKFLRPVIVWIYGGGYTLGQKDAYHPEGLLERSFIGGRHGVIIVQMNYRMGALGFGAGHTVEEGGNGMSNVGFMDQELALKWVRKHIHKFGGDPDNVTIFGQSAGGGSVIHQLTAWGKKPEKPLFHKAYSMSGGWPPVTDRNQAEDAFRQFMKYAKADSMESLRSMTTERIKMANKHLIWTAPPGSFMFGPVAWGDFTPEAPRKLMANPQKWASDTLLMASSVSDEGGQFGNVIAQTSNFSTFVADNFPLATVSERQWINETYNENGENIIEGDASAISSVIADVLFRCQHTWLSQNKKGDLYRHVWDVSPDTGHGRDMLYAFWQGNHHWGGGPADSATALQDYIVRLAIDGEPSTSVRKGLALVTQPKKYMPGEKGMFFTATSRTKAVFTLNEIDDDRCAEWAKFSFI